MDMNIDTKVNTFLKYSKLLLLLLLPLIFLYIVDS